MANEVKNELQISDEREEVIMNELKKVVIGEIQLENTLQLVQFVNKLASNQNEAIYITLGLAKIFNLH